MSYQTFWHGSDLPREKLLFGKDGGIHLGSRAQAEMRNPAFIHEVKLDTGRVRRSKDHGEWASRIKAARSAKFTTISYLNRFEGISRGDLEAAIAFSEKPESAFRKAVPSASDSVIALYEEDVMVVNVTAGKGFVTLYHGTTERNGLDLLERGFNPDDTRAGANGGRSGLLYLTTGYEDAEWFSNESGSDFVIKLQVRASDLIADPEDAVGDTAVSEIMGSLKMGFPAKLATRAAISPEMLRRASREMSASLHM